MEKEILYDFNEFNYFPNDFCVKEFSFEDLNQDGLKDLVLILTCNEDNRIKNARVYYQNNKGSFVINKDLYDELNNGKHTYNKNVQRVKEYIKKSM